MEKDYEAIKKEFLEIFDRNIRREGSDKLREYLVSKSDFFTAPASAKYHSCYAGGLCEHSINVYTRLLSLVRAEYGEEWEQHISHESIAICGLLHDVCKIDCYKLTTKRVQDPDTKQWSDQPCYTWAEELVYGHGEKSVYILSSFMRLTRDEALAINWHMGGFDSRVKGGDRGISKVYERYPLATLTHTADLLATYMDETRED